jgi:hypothetical protein
LSTKSADLDLGVFSRTRFGFDHRGECGVLHTMPRPSVYRIHVHDGAPGGIALPPERGLFELRDSEWRLHFRHLESTISCGLRRSGFDVRSIDRRRSLVTLSGRDEPVFTLQLLLWARARSIRTDFERRLARLDETRDALEAVERGEWWRDARVFERFGPLGTMSLTGVRYRGGLPRTSKVKTTRIGQLMDFGPTGITLRGWRTHLSIPWEQVARIEPGSFPKGTPQSQPPRSETDAPQIVVGLSDGSRVRFSVPGSSEKGLRARLEPISDCLDPVFSKSSRKRDGTDL